jgi:hypothetical protein
MKTTKTYAAILGASVLSLGTMIAISQPASAQTRNSAQNRNAPQTRTQMNQRRDTGPVARQNPNRFPTATRNQGRNNVRNDNYRNDNFRNNDFNNDFRNGNNYGNGNFRNDNYRNNRSYNGPISLSATVVASNSNMPLTVQGDNGENYVIQGGFNTRYRVGDRVRVEGNLRDATIQDARVTRF